MNYIKFGTGKKIALVLHEWLGDHRNWLDTTEYLDLEKFTYYFLDLPGYGLSRGEKSEFTITNCSAEILKVADTLKLEKFSLIAHSMSGLIGHHLASNHSDRIEKLIMFCPVPPSGFNADETALKAMKSVTENQNTLKQAILARGGNLENDDWLKEKIALAETASTGEVKKGYLNMFTSPIEPQATASRIDTVTIIYGKHDLPFYSKENLKIAFEPFYKNITLIPIEKAGHYPMLQRPKQVAEILNTLL